MNLFSCGCLLLFTNMSLKCEHESDGVSTCVFVPTSVILLCAEVQYLPRAHDHYAKEAPPSRNDHALLIFPL